ncbi:hypothetical protein J27TS7_30320 [Paenibacillus dendritiformis]|nr:hypothetical protein J27TS7_30320 [Paenibacillus dendritiformis]
MPKSLFCYTTGGNKNFKLGIYKTFIGKYYIFNYLAYAETTRILHNYLTKVRKVFHRLPLAGKPLTSLLLSVNIIIL